MAGILDRHSSSEETNYMKLFRLLNCCGTKIMRRVLTYHGILKKLANPNTKQRLKRLKDRNLLTHQQWKKLYPTRRTHGNINSESLDITLMFKLWRELCKSPRIKRWNSLPDDNNLCLSADLARIKYYRNQFSHDNEDMAVGDEKFKVDSNRIKNALVRMLNACKSQDIAEWEKRMEFLLTGSGTEEDEDEVKWRQRIENGG